MTPDGSVVTRRACALGGLAVAVAAIAAYGRTFEVPFVFDDVPALVENPALHMVRLDFQSLARAAAGFPTDRWLARLTLALNHLVGGASPVGYHVVNLACHLAASWLAGLVALEVLSRVGPERSVPVSARGRTALVTALLFAVHPVQTQAVTYVVQRMTSMGAAFGLLAVWLFLRARRPGVRATPLLVGSLAATALAFSCKETYVVVPALALLLEWLLVPGLGERLARRWRASGAVALLGAALAAWLAWRYSSVLVVEHGRFAIPIHQRLLSQGAILIHYLSLLALPLPGRLHVDYFWPPATSLFDPWSTLPALLAVAALAVGAVAARRRAPLFALGVLWFIVGLSIEQTVLPIDLVFEHRLYLPAFGFFLWVAASMERALAQRVRFGAWAVAAPMILALGTATVVRNEVWREPSLLFADASASGPGASRSLISLGVRLHGMGRLQEADAVLRRALALEPGNLGARVDLGYLALDVGDRVAAERWFRQATLMDPGWMPGWFGLGKLFLDEGRYREARACYETALAIAPFDPDVLNGLGVSHRRSGDNAGALELFERALRVDPAHVLARLNRAEIWLDTGDLASADVDGRQALAFSPNDARVLGFLGEVSARAGRMAEAREWFLRTLGRAPDDPRALRGLAGLDRRLR